MRPSGYGSKSLKNRLTSCCLVLTVLLSTFAAMTLPTYDILPKANAGEDDFLTETEQDLLAWFDFNDAADNLKNTVNNGVTAKLVDVDSIKIGTEDNGEESNSYLDLTDTNAYLSLTKADGSGGVLAGKDELTVEMRVKTEEATGAQWAFYAAPNTNGPVINSDEHYLSVHMTDSTAVARRYDGIRPNGGISAPWTTGEWYTVRVVYAEDKTTISVMKDGKLIAEEHDTALSANIIDCVGDNGVLWFGAGWGGTQYFKGCIDDINIWSSANPTDDDLIASFNFENEEDRLEDTSGKNAVKATAVGATAEAHDFFPKDGANTYLDLKNRRAYLSLTKADGSGVLDNMAEVTVEMRLNMAHSDNTHWAFYAAPVGSAPSRYPVQDEHYLSIHLTDTNIVTRRYDGIRPNGTPNVAGLSADWTADEWYTVKVVYEADKTTLYVTKNGETVTKTATDLTANLWSCLGENSFLWFGYSGWGGEQFFSGYMDDIKIWGTPRTNDNIITEAVENEHIITENVVDPANTTVNMFDYWVFGNQNDRDYGFGNRPVEDLIDGGINNGRLFLFDGSASIDLGDDEGLLGLWNKYGYSGENPRQGETKWGIVNNTMSEYYPQLALEGWTAPLHQTLNDLWLDSDNRTQSLSYLFDPNEKVKNGKASYPNVTGLFRINNKGYYYFRSQEVFAELNADQPYDPGEPKKSADKNRITLYDTPWREEYARGQFFPFNDWTQLFYEVNGNIGQRGDQGKQIELGQPMNHWFGMTIETKFMQPANGTLYNGEPMKFEFSGDDDVWIFIDDVLVADVGGVHNRIRVEIDYSTGNIEYEKGLEYTGMSGTPFYGSDGTTATLRGMFEKALGKEESDKLDWNGNTFGNSTIHTLKFFYLERGNAASNCNISFNLQEPIVDRIRKVDQNGDPLAGATFDLYTADQNVVIGDNWWTYTAEDFTKDKFVTSTVSDGNGFAPLSTANGEPLNLSPGKYYILEETNAPDGYSKNPSIVLRCRKPNTLTVVNKYEVGAYASFIAEWTGPLNNSFANYDGDIFIKDNVTPVTDQQLTEGLAVVVPVFFNSRDTSAKWYPMYGSNTLGWKTVRPSGDSENDLINALAKAALMQIADTDPKTQDWYLRWNGVQFKGQMENLPGDATRYGFNGGSDGDLMTLFLPKEALDIMGVSGTFANDEDRYDALSKALAGKSENELDGLADRAAKLSGVRLIYTYGTDFEKNSRTVLYVPNEQRELRVRKVDEKGKPVESGAVFALFDDLTEAVDGDIANSVASGKTDGDGVLIFRANIPTNVEDGYAKMDWSDGITGSKTAVYWLKEITAPEGYELNESLIRIEASADGVYANATGFDTEGNLLSDEDGVEVEASLGGLTQTLVKYAEGIVDETLKHITATGQTYTNSWNDDDTKIVPLTYDAEDGAYNADDGNDPVIFTAKDGYIRVMPRQGNIDDGIAKRDDLTGVDLNGLFSLINTVVVTDRLIPDTGVLTVSKTVEVPEGEEIDTEAEFSFTVTLSDDSFEHIYTTGGKTVKFEKGVAAFTLRHGEKATFAGLPAGVTYTVAEVDIKGYKVPDDATGTIDANEDAEAEFINKMIVKDTDDTESSDDQSEFDNTPSDEPDNTPSDEPDNTPSDEPDNTPSDEPDNTPSDEPDNTPSDKPDNTPSDKPNSTPDKPNSTPDKPNSTPDKSDSTPKKPDNSTPDKPDSTPNEPDDTGSGELGEQVETSKPNENPNTMDEPILSLWLPAIMLSSIVAVNPFRKRRDQRK